MAISDVIYCMLLTGIRFETCLLTLKVFSVNTNVYYSNWESDCNVYKYIVRLLKTNKSCICQCVATGSCQYTVTGRHRYLLSSCHLAVITQWQVDTGTCHLLVIYCQYTATGRHRYLSSTCHLPVSTQWQVDTGTCHLLVTHLSVNSDRYDIYSYQLDEFHRLLCIFLACTLLNILSWTSLNASSESYSENSSLLKPAFPSLQLLVDSEDVEPFLSLHTRTKAMRVTRSRQE